MTPPAITPQCGALAIVCPSWVGDTVMATPVLRALRAHAPGARLVGVVRPGLEEVLAGTSWLNETVSLPMKGVFGPWRVAAAIRRRGCDHVLLLPNSLRSALAARLSRARVRVGYDRDGRGRLLTHPLAPPSGDRPIPTIEYYCRLAAFATGLESIDPSPELATTAEEERAADRLLEGVAGPFAVLNPGGNKPAKRWPPDRYARVADHLDRRFGLRSVVTGSPGEASLVAEVVQAATTDVVDLRARGVTLGSLKAVLRRARLLLTNDTGPRHLSAALGTPIVSLFGPTDHRWTTLPGVTEHILVAEPFLPEERIADRNPGSCAIERIAEEDVIAAAEALLERAGTMQA